MRRPPLLDSALLPKIQLGRRKHPMRARTATEAEHATLWPRLVDMYADLESYQSWTERRIPVVICEPLAVAT